MTQSDDPIRMIVDRVASEHPAPSIFFGYEFDDWPIATIEALVASGLFGETTRATSAQCTGCELDCHKPVIVRPRARDAGTGAFILCDEEPDVGRIPVRLERLRRFQVSLSGFARIIANGLGLNTVGPTELADRIRLGFVRGRNGPREVALVLGNQRIVLLVGDKQQEVTDLVHWNEDVLVIDREHFKRLADRKDRRPEKSHQVLDGVSLASSESESPVARRDREIRQHGKRLRSQGKSWPVISEAIARMSFIASPQDGLKKITGATVRRILARRATG